jgi:amino acid adenylation domain-containing protein
MTMRVDSPAEQVPCVHDLVDAQIARQGDAVAIRWRATAMSYAELGARVNRLAWSLVRAGVVTGDRVGVCLDREPDLVVTLLAVLKAGGCYVPLDPAYPRARVAMMAEDSGASLIVTTVRDRTMYAGGGARVVCLDELDLSTGPGTAPDVAVRQGDLAYLIYTSGSTGRPKGVAIEHRSVVARLRWARDTFGLRELSGMLAATSVCFDLSVFEIFAPLAWGGSLVLARDVLELAEPTAPAGVRLVNTVPSAMSELLAAGAVPSGVETVCLAGEPLTSTLAERVWRLPGVRRLLNLYGPTEDTTYSTWAEIGRDAGEPSIGSALPGTRAYVLDDDLQPVRTGELYLAGAGLSRCYHDRPVETADRYLPDPFDGAVGGRMYRTGDRVTRLGPGRLRYLGRADDQVKIRGFRVELGEVTAALTAVDGVRQATAALVTGPAGVPRLVAYLVAAGQRAPTESVVAALRASMPAHQVPSAVVWLDRLPRTPNGKVDRAALPAPDWTTPGPADTGTHAEGVIAHAFQDVLGTRIGHAEDFFAAGGDSLLAVRVIGRLRDRLAVDVSLDVLLAHPTIAGLAQRLDGLSSAPSRTPLGAGSSAATGPLSYAQQRMWFLDQLGEGGTEYLISAVIRTRFDADAAILASALGDVIATHAALRTCFRFDGDELTQHVMTDVPVELPRHRLDETTDENTQLDRLARLDAAVPMDLTRAPLIRCRLVLRDERPVALLLTAHHIVFDAWSLGLFVRDLGRAYDARSGHGGGLGPPPPGPVAIAAGERAWLAGADGQRALADVVAALRGAPHILELPTDRTPPESPTTDGAHLLLPLDPRVVDAAREFAGQHRATFYMVGLAAFAAVMSEWSGQEDLVIGTAFAGRSNPAVEESVGCLVNTVPIRVRGRAGAGIAELVADARAAALFGAAHQDVPFECVVQQLQPARADGVTPLVQVAFGVHTMACPGYRGTTARFDGHELEPRTARLDITLWLEKRPDGWCALWTYRTDLFVADTIRKLHERFTDVLTETTRVDTKGA